MKKKINIKRIIIASIVGFLIFLICLFVYAYIQDQKALDSKWDNWDGILY